MRTILSLLFVTLFVTSTNAQHFSILPEHERNAKLIKIARKVYRKNFPKDYVRYGTPDVKSFTTKENSISEIKHEDLGKQFYTVCFKYDKKREPKKYSGNYCCIVYISDKCGKAYNIAINSYYGGFGKFLL